jgi:hypothetical protein
MSVTGTRSLGFAIHSAEEGGYWARADDYAIFTQADDLDGLARMILDAAACHFDDWDENPRQIVWRFGDE